MSPTLLDRDQRSLSPEDWQRRDQLPLALRPSLVSSSSCSDEESMEIHPSAERLPSGHRAIAGLVYICLLVLNFAYRESSNAPSENWLQWRGLTVCFGRQRTLLLYLFRPYQWSTLPACARSLLGVSFLPASKILKLLEKSSI